MHLLEYHVSTRVYGTDVEHAARRVAACNCRKNM
jgi:hypothetical protein